MKKIFAIFLIFFINIHGTLPKKPWTVFFYLCGHNNLWNHLQNPGLCTLPAGANNNVNIISSASLYTGTNCSNPPSCSNVTQCQNISTQRFITSSKGNTQIGPTVFNLNTALEATLTNELTFAIQTAPSNFLTIFLAGHGDGPAYGCCLDQQGGFLTDIAIQNSLKAVMKLRAGKKTEVLVIDCCYMAGLEYYFAWADYTDFIVGSQATDPGNGIPYVGSLNSLKTNLVPKNFAKAIVSSFSDTYNSDPGQQQFTLAAVDSTKILPICHNVDNVAKIFLGLLASSNKQATLNLITTSACTVTNFCQSECYDLNGLYLSLIKNAKSNPIFKKLVTELKKGIALIQKAIIQNGTITPGASGLTIFCPNLTPGCYFCASGYCQTLFTKKFPNWSTLMATISPNPNNCHLT